jgi:transcriptional regulator with XRE-family HTH domain
MLVIKRIDNKKTALLLREALRKRGARQSFVSNVIKINQSQVSRLLKGQFQLSSKGFNALCVYLKVTPVVRNGSIKLPDYPDLASCLDDVLDGSRTREKAVIRLLKSAQSLT